MSEAVFMTGEFAIAVHAIVYLNHKRSYLSSEALAKNICTTPARVRMVMSKLKRGGIILTREGAAGGYAVREGVSDLSLLEVAETVGTTFVGSAWRSGDSDMKCLVASGMADVMDGFYSEMDGLCRSYLSKVHISDVEEMIFKGKGDLDACGRGD